MKRLIAAVLAVITALALTVTAQAAGGSLEHFTVQRTYTNGQYTDVPTASWYAMYVQADYEFGLINGVSASRFAPNSSLTVAEAVKLAACLHRQYYTGSMTFSAAEPWYTPYIDYALQHGIVDSAPVDPTAPVTRAAFAELITAALPSDALGTVNTIANNGVPDVMLSDSFGASVYALYRAGVLTGCNSAGAFRPYATLTRAEAAAVVARAADPAFRKHFTLPAVLNTAQLFEAASPAVFYLEMFSDSGSLLGIGSGFFITRDGLAVTCYHTIAGAASATATMADGTVYDVTGVRGFDVTNDLALIEIDDAGFSYLTLGDAASLTPGTPICVIGSPFGLINSMSTGLISNTTQIIEDVPYLQISAPISLGTGGGPVLDMYGRVVGVTCLSVSSSQTLNFAIPSDRINDIEVLQLMSFELFNAVSSGTSAYYLNHFPVPNYGTYLDIPLFDSYYDDQTGDQTYYYDQNDITYEYDIAVLGYYNALRRSGFEQQDTYVSSGGYDVTVWYCAEYDVTVHFGATLHNDVLCRFVTILGS